MHWLKVNRRGELSREDIRCHALYRAVNARRADLVIARLDAGNVLRLVRPQGPHQPGRPAERWQVNPALFP